MCVHLWAEHACLPVSAQVLNTPTTSADLFFFFLLLYLPVTLPTVLSADWTAQTSPSALAWCHSCALPSPFFPSPSSLPFLFVLFVSLSSLLPLLPYEQQVTERIFLRHYCKAAAATCHQAQLRERSVQRRRRIPCLPSSGGETELFGCPLSAHKERETGKDIGVHELGSWWQISTQFTESRIECLFVTFFFFLSQPNRWDWIWPWSVLLSC